jgi:hypothetical protein
MGWFRAGKVAPSFGHPTAPSTPFTSKTTLSHPHSGPEACASVPYRESMMKTGFMLFIYSWVDAFGAGVSTSDRCHSGRVDPALSEISAH